MSMRTDCPHCRARTGERCVTTTTGQPARFLHTSRFDRYRDRMRREEFLVRLVGDDERFGLKDGDELVCVRYPYDNEKATVLHRLSDGYDPECNQYWHDIRFVGFVRDLLEAIVPARGVQGSTDVDKDNQQ